MLREELHDHLYHSFRRIHRQTSFELGMLCFVIALVAIALLVHFFNA